jgi:hypothetical protein
MRSVEAPRDHPGRVRREAAQPRNEPGERELTTDPHRFSQHMEEQSDGRRGDRQHIENLSSDLRPARRDVPSFAASFGFLGLACATYGDAETLLPVVGAPATAGQSWI